MSVALVPLALFVVAQVGTPGPANMVLLAAGARWGLRKALPFVLGVVIGKQLLIWPLGLGLMELSHVVPAALSVLRWLAAAYVLWLAWRIAGMRLSAPGAETGSPPGLAAGLMVHPLNPMVHPLNPKAWGMVLAAFAAFAAPGSAPAVVTAVVASVFLAGQLLLHPLWCWGGARIAATLAGHPAEPWLMRGLAALTVVAVLHALISGGAA